MSAATAATDATTVPAATSRPSLPALAIIRRPRSFDGDRGRLARRKPVVAAPLEGKRAALGRGGKKRDERIGRNRRRQLGTEDFRAVVGAGEHRDDVARDQGTVGSDPIAG